LYDEDMAKGGAGMKRIVALVLVVLLLTGLTATAGVQGVEDLNKSTAAFSLKLFEQAVQSGDKNVVISPVSAYLALSLAAAGADGETLKAFGEVLGVDAKALASYCSGLSTSLMQTQGNTTIVAANSVWIDEGFSVDAGYLKRIASEMKAEALVKDLDSETTRDAINAWVSGKTNGLIPSLLDQNLNKEAVLALINTLYFKAEWRDPFDANDTRENEFIRKDGSRVSVPFLNEYRCDRDYISTDGIEGVLRPYDDGKTAFLALRATDGRSAQELAGELDADLLARYIASAKETYMTLSMPKFTLDYGMTMNDALIALGLGRAFDQDLAEFGLMGKSERGNIFISEVLQKVRVEVNEKGTEAVAATIVEMMAGSAMPVNEPVVLTLDSPFVYAVVDLQTGIPLFIGCMDDPSMSV
jgi:serine protease inhibitor